MLLFIISLLYTNKDIFNYIINNEQNKKLINIILNNILILKKNKNNMIYIRVLIVNIIKKCKINFNYEFISYLLDLLFQILEDNILSKKDKIKPMYLILLRTLLNFIVDKKELRDNLINLIMKIFIIFSNYINSKNNETNINESILFSIFEIIVQFLGNLDNDNSIKNEIMEKKINKDMSLYDLCLNKFFSKELEKIYKKNEKSKRLEKIMEKDKENKFISLEKINEIKNDKRNEIKTEENIYKELILYCTLYLKSKNGNRIDNLNKIFSKLKEIKEKEDKENNSSKSEENNSSNKKIKSKYLKKKRIKKKSEYSGLRNLGSLCFLNSVIQQLYMIPQFRYSILDADDNKEPIKSEFLEDDNILHQLQKLFIYLSFTSFGEVIPKDLILAIKGFDGQPIPPNMMQDSCEFYNNFCDIIEESLKNTKYKYLIKNLFIGKICNKNTCGSCNNTTYRYEEFKHITLEVKGLNNIYESLDKYISDDNIEDYKCSNCNQKVTLNKKALFSD